MSNGVATAEKAADEPKTRLERLLINIRKAKETSENVVTLPIEVIHPWKDQPRKHFPKKKIQGMANSINRFGQKTPIQVKADPEHPGHFGITDGECRYKACLLINRKVMQALILPAEDDRDRLVRSAINNFFRTGHTPYEDACLVRELSSMGFSVGDLVAMLGKSNCWVYQHLALTKLDERVVALMDYERPFENRLKFAIALLLANLPGDLQLAIAVEITEKEMRSKAARHFVQVKAAEAGYIAGGMARRPEKRRGSLKSLVTLLEEALPTFMEAPDISLHDFLAGFTEADLETMLESAKKSLSEWQILCDAAEETLTEIRADKEKVVRNDNTPKKQRSKRS